MPPSFQSTPAHQDGRNVIAVRLTNTHLVFQSTPAHQDGRNTRTPTVRCGTRSVSIHSRPPGREKLPTPRQIASVKRFNPLPPTRTGETGVFFNKRPSQAFQSTPAHQDGRNPEPDSRAAARASFNPLPPTRTGETSEWRFVPARVQVSIHSRPPGREKRIT